MEPPLSGYAYGLKDMGTVLRDILSERMPEYLLQELEILEARLRHERK